MSPQDICVVIPTLNEADGLAAAIASVAAAGQIIVVDGGSTDGTIEIARSHRQVTLVSSSRGRGIQLAAGADRCSRTVLLFLHGDCRLSPGGMNQISDAAARGYRWGALQQQIAASGFRYRLLERGNAARVRWLRIAYGDQAMFVTAELYRQVGGFEPIALMEDLRLSERLRRSVAPALVKGPVIVSARRWVSRGVLRQTLANWYLLGLHWLGKSPAEIERYYR